jgi:hypothetical protein
MQSTWQEQATTAEQEARQFRRDLDAQGCLRQALQKQFEEELARQVSKGHAPRHQKSKEHE